MTMIPIPAGSLFTITSGEYSDYHVRGVFRAIVDIDADALRRDWVAAHPDQNDDYHFREDQFLGWIARMGLLECVDAYEWHLGSYSNISAMDVTKIENDDAVS